VEIKPDLSKGRSDVSFTMISGQLYNNPINNELLEQGTGTKL